MVPHKQENMIRHCHLGEAPAYSDDAVIVENTSRVLRNCTARTFELRQLSFAGKDVAVTMCPSRSRGVHVRLAVDKHHMAASLKIKLAEFVSSVKSENTLIPFINTKF